MSGQGGSAPSVAGGSAAAAAAAAGGGGVDVAAHADGVQEPVRAQAQVDGAGVHAQAEELLAGVAPSLQALVDMLAEMQFAQSELSGMMAAQRRAHDECVAGELDTLSVTFGKLPQYADKVDGLSKRMAALTARIAKLQRATLSQETKTRQELRDINGPAVPSAGGGGCGGGAGASASAGAGVEDDDGDGGGDDGDDGDGDDSGDDEDDVGTSHGSELP